jgi:hypothetical protein
MRGIIELTLNILVRGSSQSGKLAQFVYLTRNVKAACVVAIKDPAMSRAGPRQVCGANIVYWRGLTGS